MEKFTEKSIYRHKEIEHMYKMPKRHRLKLSSLSTKKSDNLTGDLADKLKQLSDLYERGSLTKEEYNKAMNLAFDITPAKYVTGLITEKGVCEASTEGLKRLFK